MKKRYQVTVKGNVQRVGFRNFAGQIARTLDLVGKAVYVDQSIMIEVEGLMKNIEVFMSWCKVGPEGCEVTEVDIIEMIPQGDDTFEVIHGITFTDNSIAV